MKKTMLIFTSIIVFMAFSQIALGWNQGKVVDKSLEETDTFYISQSSPLEDTWETFRILKYSNGDEVIDIFTSYFLALDNEKAKIKFIIDSDRTIKLDMYTWGGGIHNTARVYIDANSFKYKNLISQMKSGKSMEIIVTNSKDRTKSFKISLEGFTRAYNELNISK